MFKVCTTIYWKRLRNAKPLILAGWKFVKATIQNKTGPAKGYVRTYIQIHHLLTNKPSACHPSNHWATGDANHRTSRKITDQLRMVDVAPPAGEEPSAKAPSCASSSLVCPKSGEILYEEIHSQKMSEVCLDAESKPV